MITCQSRLTWRSFSARLNGLLRRRQWQQQKDSGVCENGSHRTERTHNRPRQSGAKARRRDNTPNFDGSETASIPNGKREPGRVEALDPRGCVGPCRRTQIRGR
jgi:hypothetical protein